MSHYALLGSPFLGPEVWEPTAEALRLGGAQATVVVSTGDSPAEVLAELAARLPSGPGLVLVPHSNAGLYVAALAQRAPVSAVVFVDALLPGPGPETPVTSRALATALAALVDDDGRLPEWTRWWPEESVAGLFDAPEQRDAVEHGQRRLPASYLTGVVPTPAGWRQLPSAYLGFGETYAEELTLARNEGWPVMVLPGRHLHQVVAPTDVAHGVRTLAERATAEPGAQ